MALSEVQEKADVALKPIKLSVTLASLNENICCEKKSSRRMRVMSIGIKTTQKSNSKAPKQIIAGIHEAAVRKWFGGGGQVRTTSLHKILKSWSISTLWKPQKWAAFSYMEMLPHCTPLHSLFPEHCDSLTAGPGQSKGAPTTVSCLSRMPPAATYGRDKKKAKHTTNIGIYVVFCLFSKNA